MIKLEEYKTTTEVAKEYGISRQAIHEWRKLGAPHIVMGKQTILYNTYELHQWLLKNMSNRKNRGVIK